MERVVVIGGGGAGTAAATITKRLNPELKVSVFTEFSDIAYSPCGIPFVHGREIEKFDDLFLSTVQRYEEDGLDMRMETVVTDIDLARRTITTKNQPEGFDQLILCTGFFWEQPDVPGANLDGLHYVKDIRKSMEFDKQLDSMKRIVVVGAGPVGVEMAGGLARRGLQVDLVDEGPWVLHEILDPDVAKPVHDSLEARGVTLHLGTKVESFEGNADGHVRAVTTSDGVLECDAVVTGLHKVPNTKLAEAAGLRLGTTGAVVVDDHMRTSAPGVWAAGDAAEYDSVLHGRRMRIEHWEVARAQGKAVARAIAGTPADFDEVPYFWSDLADWVTVEYIGPASQWDREVVRGSLDDGEFAVFYLAGGRVAAALSVGRAEDLMEARRLLADGVDLSGREGSLADLSVDLGGLA
jgi:NADH oxidase (H2O2-forming)